MKNSTSELKVIGGVLIGVAVGTALGILFAPDKGVKTRNKIKRNTNDMLKQVKKRIKDETKKMEKKFQEVSDNLLESKFELQKDGSLARTHILNKFI